ncbi:hypothetical protein [Rufibacter sp. LB8]|uniref:hypothetical protein n=1 Tax=Rufibacter sp. LB8 TaxID=2777781 RepID=UPI00178C2A56|nr:hypothetical protein [Rufibacter sp. LB8]
MKNLYTGLVIAFAFCLGTQQASAQYNYVQAASRAMAANQMNHNMQFQMMHMMHMTMARQSTALYNPKATYQVVLLDSSEIMVKSKIMFDEKNRSYLEQENPKLRKSDPNRIQKIYPSDTRVIRKLDGYGRLLTPGLPADSCWLFKQVSGKINGYTFLPMGEGLDIGYFKFLQKGETGPLQRIHKDSMLVMMQDNEKAVKLLQKNKAFDALTKYNQQ